VVIRADIAERHLLGPNSVFQRVQIMPSFQSWTTENLGLWGTGSA